MRSEIEMLSEYDFSNGRKNPYVSGLKRDFTISLDLGLIAKLEEIADKQGVSVDRIVDRMLAQYAEWIEK